jgi:L-lactate dehydrogenase complex protein LldE
VFETSEVVVTPSASCCAMVREHFQVLFQDDPAWQEDARRLSERTFEFTEFLTRVLKVKFAQFALPAPTAVTLHYACHLRLLGSSGAETLKFLKQLGNVEYRAMERMDQCCGFGGTFAVKYPAISRAMSEEKVAAIAKTGAGVTVCNEAGCGLNIEGMCRKEGVKTEVKHVAEVIAEAMGLDLTV